uniref:Elongin A, like n=1 Tax=Astyanax mexicanus TaxID=7994 RepID=A0A8B9JTK7_ASTMX
MASVDVKKVLQLKQQLKESAEGHTLLKILKKLQELDITLDILAETGIGKVVNSFRKHDYAGEVAKSLIYRWKKLVPKDPASVMPPPIPPLKEQSKSELQQTDQEEKEQASASMSSSEREPKNEITGFDWKPSKKANGLSKWQPALDKPKSEADSEKKGDDKKDADIRHLSQAAKKKSFQSKEKSTSNSQAEQNDKHKKVQKKVSDITNKHRLKSSEKNKRSSLNKYDLIEVQRKKKRTVFKQEDNEKKKTKPKAADMEMDPESGCFEMPSMSFEACLNYDIEAPKWRKKSSDNKHQKRLRTGFKKNATVSSVKSGTEVPSTMASKGSVLELLSVPLPPISTECEDLSQYQYFVKRTVEEKPTDIFEDTPVFTGQRLNKKMQVYSGSKAVYLPTMMSLYQQCIRTLQNNIDSLYEIGGVPFEILEPVLERCTPEQLLRIEECNPVYIGVTDHLWERHCCKDFRNARLEEYESWREMYLRLFEERDRKLQQLTKSIVLAHSGKPKGRQVKMAFIHSAAKPPRNVRIQQELHGTASAVLPYPTDKPSGKSHESRAKSCFSESTKHSPTSSGPSQCQDPRKIRSKLSRSLFMCCTFFSR